jgi:hypothetical protein
MNLLAALALICCQSVTIPKAQLQLLPLTTNAFTNIVAVLEYAPITTPCPECGLANHHELRVARVESGYFVTATLIAGDQTNKVVVYRSPRTNFLSTNTVLRSVHRQQQPGWTGPPPISP